MGRYISYNKSLWRMLGFEIDERHPTVMNLAVHLENSQRYYFTEYTVRNVVENKPETSLIAFFK